MIDAFSVFTTFVASIRSVGTACTMAMLGVYLHRRSFIVGEGKRTLALISQQVTIPLFLFTKIVYCNQDWSDAACPDITSKLEDVWVLLLWPAYVVSWGLVVGWVAAYVSKTPPEQFRSVLAACAFGNSTGLPITLLTVVHANFPDTTELGRVDPTLFLSVYLLLYPVLQWGVGGWLLAPQEEEGEEDESDEEEQDGNTSPLLKHSHEDRSVEDGHTEQSLLSPKRLRRTSTPGHVGRNVLNNKEMLHHYEYLRRGISETDASLYISNADLVQFASQFEVIPPPPVQPGLLPPTPQSPTIEGSAAAAAGKLQTYQIQDYSNTTQQPQQSLSSPAYQRRNQSTAIPMESSTEKSLLLQPADNNGDDSSSKSCASSVFETERLWEIFTKIVSRCLQPPVVGAMLGLLVASTPLLRGIFVDLDRRSAAPLEWLFDGFYAIGQAAVPINMMILGCNLSASQLTKPGSASLLSSKTMAAIVVGKMVVMPIVGICTALLFDRYFWHVPESINASFYLVCMIVFITPTANNVMVMVELSGSGTREGIAQVIAWQYAVAPIVLSLTMTVVVGVASSWS